MVGIFAVVLITIIEGYNYSRNMFFTDCCHRIVIKLYIQYFAFVAAIVLFIIFTPVSYENADLLFPVITVVIR